MSDILQVVVGRVAAVVSLAGFVDASEAAANDATAEDDTKAHE